MSKEIRTNKDSKYNFLEGKTINDEWKQMHRLSKDKPLFADNLLCVGQKQPFLKKNLYVRVISTNQKLKREVEEMTYFRFLPVIIRIR